MIILCCDHCTAEWVYVWPKLKAVLWWAVLPLELPPFFDSQLLLLHTQGEVGLPGPNGIPSDTTHPIVGPTRTTILPDHYKVKRGTRGKRGEEAAPLSCVQPLPQWSRPLGQAPQRSWRLPDSYQAPREMAPPFLSNNCGLKPRENPLRKRRPLLRPTSLRCRQLVAMA